MALDFFLHAERYGPDAKGLMLRKTREDLKDFIDLASQMYTGSAVYREKGNAFHFANGALALAAPISKMSGTRSPIRVGA